jgi:hypothetical protein
MAIMDERTAFGDSFDCDLEASTALLTNQIDLGAAGEDPGNGQVVYMNVAVTETFTDGGDSATLQLRVASDASAAIHATASTGHLLTAPMLKALLVAGNTFSFALPVSGLAYERYLGVQAIIATAGFDAGMIDVWLSPDPMGWKAVPDATN